MLEKENLRDGVLLGIILSIVIGAVISFILKPAFGSIILILSLAMLPGFLIMTLLYAYKLGKEKISLEGNKEIFEWGVEVNLRRLQIIHTKYASMIQSAGFVAMGSFFSMVFIAKDFPNWGTGSMIFFPLATALFIFSIHSAFRWWFAMREDYKYLKFRKGK